MTLGIHREHFRHSLLTHSPTKIKKGNERSVREDAALRLTIPARLRRCGNEIRIIHNNTLHSTSISPLFSPRISSNLCLRAVLPLKCRWPSLGWRPARLGRTAPTVWLLFNKKCRALAAYFSGGCAQLLISASSPSEPSQSSSETTHAFSALVRQTYVCTHLCAGRNFPKSRGKAI